MRAVIYRLWIATFLLGTAMFFQNCSEPSTKSEQIAEKSPSEFSGIHLKYHKSKI